MIGFRAEPSVIDGKPIWLVIDLSNDQVVAKGQTVSEAVKNLEEGEEEKCSM